MEALKSTKAVIDALGGIGAVAQLTGRKYQAVWNWAQWKHFPADTYVVMQIALRNKGYRAPSALWRQVQPPEAQPPDDAKPQRASA